MSGILKLFLEFFGDFLEFLWKIASKFLEIIGIKILENNINEIDPRFIILLLVVTIFSVAFFCYKDNKELGLNYKKGDKLQ